MAWYGPQSGDCSCCVPPDCEDIALDDDGDPICTDFEPASYPSTVDVYLPGDLNLDNANCSDCTNHSLSSGTYVLDLISETINGAVYEYRETDILSGCSACGSEPDSTNADFVITFSLGRNTFYSGGPSGPCCTDSLTFDYREDGSNNPSWALSFYRQRPIKVGAGYTIDYEVSDLVLAWNTPSAPYQACLCGAAFPYPVTASATI